MLFFVVEWYYHGEEGAFIMDIVLYVLLGLLAILVSFILFVVISGLLVNTKKEYDQHSKFYRFLVNVVTWLTLWCSRVRIHVTGAEKVPKTNVLFVGNHRSNYDSLVTWQVFKKWNVAYISKDSNFRIPICGRLIRRCCFLAIDRENPRNAIKTINKAAELIHQENISYGVYPEGTRNKAYTGLLPFHNGVFKIAQKANVPVVVVAVHGTEKIHKHAPWHHTDVYLDVLDVMDAAFVKENGTAVIGDRVQQLLLVHLEDK